MNATTQLAQQFDIDFPEDEIAWFDWNIRNIRLGKGEYFFRQGQVCNEIGLVVKGLLRSYVSVDGKEYNVEFYSENQFVSAFTSFLTRQPSEWTIQALEDSSLIIVTSDMLSELYRRHACWVRLGKAIFEQQTLKKCRREKSLISENAATRFEIFNQEYRTIQNRIPLYHVAAYLGITPETLSRLRSK